MSLDEFEAWLQANPNHWTPVANEFAFSDHSLSFPPVYQEFLQRFGSIRLNGHYIFLNAESAANEFEVSSSHQPQDLIPFLRLGYDGCILCFRGEHIIDYCPLNGETYVAANLNEFLQRFTSADGEEYWLHQDSNDA